MMTCPFRTASLSPKLPVFPFLLTLRHREKSGSRTKRPGMSCRFGILYYVPLLYNMQPVGLANISISWCALIATFFIYTSIGCSVYLTPDKNNSNILASQSSLVGQSSIVLLLSNPSKNATTIIFCQYICMFTF